jgi:hypothetical protein
MEGTTKALILGGIGAGLLLLSRVLKGANVEPREFAPPRKLTANFDQLEFQDEYPELRTHKLTRTELSNLTRLATVAQRLRDKYGPMRVNSGVRVRGLVVTVPEALRARLGTMAPMHDVIKGKGYNPSATSDHDVCAAGDFEILNAKPETYPAAAIDAARMLEVRQVILYYKTDATTGKAVPSRLHIGVISAGRPKVKSPNYAFVIIDEKRFPGELEWRLATSSKALV